MLHKIPHTILTESELPTAFTFPFCYTPHALCRYAAHEVRSYLATQESWHEELARGKMFGVLVVETQAQEVAFLAAFSGNLAGGNQHDYFVPPVYDLLNPEGFFKQEEAEISALNQEIQALQKSPQYGALKVALEEATHYFQARIAQEKRVLTEAKEDRDTRRKRGDITPEEVAAMVKESQFLKAEYKRKEQQARAELDEIQQAVAHYEAEITARKAIRKAHSADLQRRMFAQFELLNAKGEVSNLLTIFAPTPQQIPPAGAGECAGPKLLQYAYREGLRPLCMAEFWWGASPKGELRRDGDFYPACSGKCKPILGFMLEGLKVEENPLATPSKAASTLSILYEDEWIVAIHKPAGLLSVPGKLGQPSVVTLLSDYLPKQITPLLVHRLDMDTSGILLAAKTKEVHQRLQAQFEQRQVKKRYLALLEGIIPQESGIIDLPLCPDPLDRPRQRVDHSHGKSAITRYQVISHHGGRTLIHLFPQTGRTHQLRVHAAHPEGLNAPIVGDPLYGNASTRLCLHAEWIEFTHPIRREKMEIEALLDELNSF